jgi:formylglycine-generating enzyme required for sulfatase activity
MKCFAASGLFVGLLIGLSFCAGAPPEQKPAPASTASTSKFPQETSNSVGMKLVLIPAGEFMMGSGDKAEDLAKEFPQYGLKAEFFSDEFPRHLVRITKPFYFGKYEVTNGEFKKFVEATGYKTQAERQENSRRGSGGWGFNQAEQKFEGRDPKYNWRNPGFPVPDNQPAVDITWNDAVAFCDWLSKKENKKYRLPTEAEWEYAARGGTTTRYWNGNDPNSLAKIANTADADFFAKFPTYYPKDKTVSTHDGFSLPAPVGSFPANKFGLCDVHGNVWEWTNDWYGADYYAKSPVDDPIGPADGGQKVRRGGAWHTAPLFARSSFRNYNTVDSRYPNLGFRVVLETPHAEK